MMGADLESKVSDIVVEQLGVTKEEIVPEASFTEDLGADSLEALAYIRDRLQS